ncbi:MAG: hypothetical protein K2W82_16970 [Candidatus Obscuribacterales bacterium]|nr:hypothetical protein [Candidatus Obscuribacterales bacterium]
MIFPWSHILVVAGLLLGAIVFLAVGCAFQRWCEQRWLCPFPFWSPAESAVYRGSYAAINAVITLAAVAIYRFDLLPSALIGGALLSISGLSLYFIWFLFFSSKRSANRIS